MVIYDRRLPFILKLAHNLSRLKEQARAEAFEQYTDDVVRDVKRIIDLKRKMNKGEVS